MRLGTKEGILIDIFTSCDINEVFPSISAQRTIEHGSIETNELNMIPMSQMTHHDSV